MISSIVADKTKEHQQFPPIDQPLFVPKSRPAVPPVTIALGTRLGLLTLTSDPQPRTRRIHGWPCTCTWGATSSRERYEEAHLGDPGYFPAWPAGDPFPPPCSKTAEYTTADARCDCGREVYNLEVTGGRTQHRMCSDCYRRIRSTSTARVTLGMVMGETYGRVSGSEATH